MIRKMIIEDYEEVHQLWINTPGMGLNDLDDSKKGFEKYLKRNPDTCFVAVNNNELMGVILCGNDGRRGFIYHMAVAEGARNQGIGKLLVSNAIEALEKEGINKVALVAFSKNQLGNSFWESQGFDVRDDLVYRNKSIRNQ